MKVEQVAVDALIPYALNNMKHPEVQVDRIATSIQQFGFNVPLVIDKDNVVVAGHGRLLAAKKLGLKEVPCVRADHLTEAQVRAYRVLDNSLPRQGEWDFENLSIELDVMKADGFNFEEWGLDNLAKLDLEAKESIERAEQLTQVDEDQPIEPTEEEKIFIKRGDLIELGPHRLLCGDSTIAEDVEEAMGSEKADMVFTDPPYGVNVQGGKSKAHIAGDLTQTAIPFSFELAVSSATADGARLYFCGGENNLYLYQKLFEKHCRQLPRHLIWVKNGFVMKPNGYHNQYEIIFHGYKQGGGALDNWFGERTENAASDVWRISRDAPSSYVHPTQKPIALPARAISNSCPPGGLVYEPFCGSGSTLMACEQLSRRCFAIELEPKYCQVIIYRYRKYCQENGKEFRCMINGEPYEPKES